MADVRVSIRAGRTRTGRVAPPAVEGNGHAAIARASPW